MSQPQSTSNVAFFGAAVLVTAVAISLVAGHRQVVGDWKQRMRQEAISKGLTDLEADVLVEEGAVTYYDKVHGNTTWTLRPFFYGSDEYLEALLWALGRGLAIAVLIVALLARFTRSQPPQTPEPT